MAVLTTSQGLPEGPIATPQAESVGGIGEVDPATQGQGLGTGAGVATPLPGDPNAGNPYAQLAQTAVADPSAVQPVYPTNPDLGNQPDQANAQVTTAQGNAPTASTAVSGSPAGLPSSSDLAALAPAPIQDFGALPSVTPTYANAAQAGTTTGSAAQQGYASTAAAAMDPTFAQTAQQGYATTGSAQQGAVGANAALVNPQQSQQYLNEYAGLLGTSLAPAFAQQQSQLQDSSAARGISNSGTAGYLQGNLEGQQAAAYASALEPMVSQGYGYSQSDIAANQANQQQVGLANQGAANTALGANAGYAQQALLSNQSAANTAYGANAQLAQQANLTNAGYANTASQFNAGNQQQANLSNQAAINTADANNAQLSQNMELANLGALNTGSQYNASNQQQANLANAGAANAATGTNAQYYASALGQNASNYNNYLNELFGAGTSESGSELAAYLNSFGPNTGVTNAITTGEQASGNIFGNVYGNAQQGASSNLNSGLAAYGEVAAAGA